MPIFGSADARLPRVLVATDGREQPAPGPGIGLLLRDLDLPALVTVASTLAGVSTLVVDLDSVEGLNADASAAAVAIRELGIDAVMTRRPAAAARAAELGALGLVRVFAFDSTGLGRTLETHPAAPGVGTAVSPGPVLGHLSPDDLVRLPRPLLAYGLIASAALGHVLLERADAVVVASDAAAALRSALDEESMVGGVAES